MAKFARLDNQEKRKLLQPREGDARPYSHDVDY